MWVCPVFVCMRWVGGRCLPIWIFTHTHAYSDRHTNTYTVITTTFAIAHASNIHIICITLLWDIYFISVIVYSYFIIMQWTTFICDAHAIRHIFEILSIYRKIIVLYLIGERNLLRKQRHLLIVWLLPSNLANIPAAVRYFVCFVSYIYTFIQ